MDRRIGRKIDFMISSRKKSYPSGIFQPYQWIPKNQKMDILPANLFQPVVNISWGHMSCHKKIGPIGFGRFRGLLENLLNFFLLSMGEGGSAPNEAWKPLAKFWLIQGGDWATLPGTAFASGRVYFDWIQTCEPTDVIRWWAIISI